MVVFKMASVSTIAALLTIVPTTFAGTASHQNVGEEFQYGPVIYKKIRSLVEIGVDLQRERRAAASALSKVNAASSSTSGSNATTRNLMGEEVCDEQQTLRCFYECVAQNMDADECIDYIEAILGEDLACHEIPDLKIIVNKPRPDDVRRDTYWMFGIPTNVFGKVDCNINGGIISYPWTWRAGGGIGYGIPDVPCIGLQADECCTKVLKAVTTAGIPLVDDNGNCFSCWVHQEPLEPIIGSGGGVAYIEHQESLTVSGTCEAIELTPAEVTTADTDANAAIAVAVGKVQAVLDAGEVLCSDFSALQLELLLTARAVPFAMSKISGLLCGICGNLSLTYTLTPDMIVRLQFIIAKLTNTPVDSIENCIIIYTDHHGKVMEPPKIGGSRAELDWDRDDPECPLCEPPQVLDLNGDCVCPGPYFITDPGVDGCKCRDEDAILSDDGLTCECKDPFVDDNMGGCKCKNPKGCSTDKCPFPQVERADGTCVCVEPFVSDGDDGCMCPPPLKQMPMGPIGDKTVCECKAPEFALNANGQCECAHPDLVYDFAEGECICTAGRTRKDNSPNNPKCECESPKTYDPVNDMCKCMGDFMNDPERPGKCQCTGGRINNGSDECVCPLGDIKQVFNEAMQMCQCIPPFFNDGLGGCECAGDGIEENGSCICPEPISFYSEELQQCICPPPLEDDGMGGCMCTGGRKFNAADGTCDCENETTQEFSEELNTCVCELPYVLDTNGECNCDTSQEGFNATTTPECICDAPKEFVDEVGCVCAPPLVPDMIGSCKCPLLGQQYDPTTGACACPDRKELVTGPDGEQSCACIAPPFVPDGMGGCTCEPGTGLLPKMDPLTGEYMCECPERQVFDENLNQCVCAPPDYTPDGIGGCKCSGDRLFTLDETTGEFICICAPPKTWDPAMKKCKCLGPFLQPDGNDGCKCAGGRYLDVNGECVCPMNKPENPATGNCECVYPEVPSGPRGDCLCQAPFKVVDDVCKCEPPLTFDDVGGCNACENGNLPSNNCQPQLNCPGNRIDFPGPPEECVCDASQGLIENPYDVSGNCICEPPLMMNMQTGACECKDPFVGGIGDCKCRSPFVFDGVDGCDACENPDFIPERNCVGGPCPPNSSLVGVDCVCNEGYQDDGEGGCEMKPIVCEAPKIPDSTGTMCVCPPGAILKDGECTEPCTIRDIINNFGQDLPCGNVFTDCLKFNCGDDWNEDCLDLLMGHLPEFYWNDETRWNNCFVNDYLVPGGGCLAGKSKCYTKKSKSTTKTYTKKSIYTKSFYTSKSFYYTKYNRRRATETTPEQQRAPASGSRGARRARELKPRATEMVVPDDEQKQRELTLNFFQFPDFYFGLTKSSTTTTKSYFTKTYTKSSSKKSSSKSKSKTKTKSSSKDKSDPNPPTPSNCALECATLSPGCKPYGYVSTPGPGPQPSTKSTTKTKAKTGSTKSTTSKKGFFRRDRR